MPKNKKFIGVLIVIILAVGLLIFFSRIKTVKKEKDRATQNLPKGISLIKSGENALPQGFPEIPLNGKTALSHSYTLRYAGQQQDQKIIDFTSSKSVKENVEFYKNWAEKNKWNILHESGNTENEGRLAIEKEKKPLNITIIKDKADPKLSRVNMSW